MLGLDDLILEMQNKFDQLEMMTQGILLENQADSLSLDEETILASLDSMISRAQLLEEQQHVRIEKDNPDVEARIQRYQRDFTELQRRKLEVNTKLMHVQNLDVPAIMTHVRAEKQAILKSALLECAKIVGAMPAATRDEVDAIFRRALMRTCKASVANFIHSFV
jgi:hypothetical protein